MPLIRDLSCTQHLLSHTEEGALCQGHHVMVVCVGLVRLQHGEFRIVMRGDALIAEILADLVDSIQPAHDEPLQIELVGDAQVYLLIQGVVVSGEGSRHRPSIHGLENRCLHLDEPAGIHEATQGGDDVTAQDEDAARLFVDDKVQVSLPVAGLHVLQAVPLLRQWPEGLGQQGQLVHPKAGLAGTREEERALGLDNVTDVQIPLEQIVGLFVHSIVSKSHVDLNAAAAIGDVREGSLTHHPHAHHAPAHLDDLRRSPLFPLFLPLLEHPECLSSRMSALRTQRIGLHALLPQPLQLQPSLLQEFA